MKRVIIKVSALNAIRTRQQKTMEAISKVVMREDFPLVGSRGGVGRISKAIATETASKVIIL